ncbi:MAG: HAD hydrolase family protein, partial [bacterium]
MDVDGVLTDGHFYWDAAGTEWKRFNVQDATGIAFARDAGVSIALISGESSPCGMALVQRYANKLKIEHAYKGCHDKAAALRDFAARSRVPLAHICYIGDDAIDLAAMAIAGLPVAPANAHSSVLAQARFVT